MKTFARRWEQFLTPRYPSQLFEAILEGLLMFLIAFLRLEKTSQAPESLVLSGGSPGLRGRQNCRRSNSACLTPTLVTNFSVLRVVSGSRLGCS